MIRTFVLAGIWAAALGIMPAAADQTCFSPEETRAHVARQGLIALNDVVRSARRDGGSELISARLCETNSMLVYMIAMLGRDGRVLRMTVDARSGDVIHHR
jgi:uncharacterized membrane protein YkoI